MVRRSALATVIAALAVTSQASAAGVFIADPPSSAFVEEIRAAVSVDPSGATLWVGARLSGAADSVVWIVPRDPHAAVDLATTSWLDALEDGSAPRVVAPLDFGCDGPAETVTSGDFPLGSAIIGKKLVSTESELAALESDWGIHVDALDRVALISAMIDGDELVAVRWVPLAGASATPVLRMRGTGATLPLQLTRADASQSIDVTVALIADSRATAPFLSLVAIPATDLRWPGGGDSYRAAREALLASGTSGRFVVESANADLLTRGEWVAGAGKTPSVADAFVRRAALRGEVQGDVGTLTAAIAPALLGQATWPAPCPRGDLFAGASCKDAVSLGEAALGKADDLAFALAGVPKNRTTTRLYGRIPAGGRGRAVTLASSSGQAMPVLRRSTASGCALSPKPGGGGSGAPVNGGGDGRDAGGPQEGSEEAVVETDAQSQSSVDVNVGCNTGSESCSSDSSESDGCSSDSSESDGCSSDSSESDGCSSDSSEGGDSCSGDSESSDGCSGEEGGGDSGCGSSDGGSSGGGCSGGDGSTSGGCSSGGGGDCTVSKGKKTRPSKWFFLALALAFPLRRWSKRPSPRP